VRTGDEFRLAPEGEPSRHLRVTVHGLDGEEAGRFADDLAAALADHLDAPSEPQG
jgi:hypothetical protein